jgi:hypothetical protein
MAVPGLIRLSILAFPQECVLEPNPALVANALLIPRYDPLQPLLLGIPAAPAVPAFATSNLILHAELVAGNDQLPKLGDGTVVSLGLPGIADRSAVFNAIKTKFDIDDDLPRLSDTPAKGYTATTSIKKYLTQSYRSSFNYTGPRTPFAVTDDSYVCALRKANPTKPYVPETKINWGKVFAFILRQPALASKLGMVFQRLVIPFPGGDKNFLKEGGWLYFDFDGAGDYAPLAGQDANVNHYAGRIPALTGRRPLFAAVQFPIATTDPPGARNYDEPFVDAASYDDGFTKIVHASQAKSAELMSEDETASGPTKDFGIRLGWDDEQITIWQNRQLQASDPNNTTVANTPMGVMSYRVDVGLFSELSPAARLDPAPDNIPWHSLVRVHADNLSTNGIDLGVFDGELGVEVYPMQFAREEEGEFWLPAFFSTWHGKSLVVTDKDAFELNRHDLIVDGSGKAGATLNPFYQPVLDGGLDLKYGETYFFRVRLADITGGGPNLTDLPAYGSENPVATAPFKRYVAPRRVEITDLPDAFTQSNSLASPYTQESFTIRRPRLNYPALLFTSLDTATALTLLKNDFADLQTAQQSADPAVRAGARRPVGYFDPDVVALGIRVEVKALEMDNLLSKSGRDSYILLYETTRLFENQPQQLDQPLIAQLQYQDMPVLDVDTPAWIAAVFNPAANTGPLVLPTARAIRLTFYAIGRADEELLYFGSQAARMGEEFAIIVRKEASAEGALFIADQPVNQLKSTWLQPDDVPSVSLREQLRLAGKPDQPDNTMFQRLASALGLVPTNDLTLTGKPGERIQFGCSQFIRNHLAPDNSLITFSTKTDLTNHWITTVILEIDRDWTWDELSVNSFTFSRRQKFGKDAAYGDPIDLGLISLSRTASRLSLQNPSRKLTKIVFFDAVEPKPLKPGDFPDILELSYTIEVHLRDPALANPVNSSYTLDTTLPVTTIPGQVPKIAAAGIALSRYVETNNYSSTERRDKYLWIELEEPIADPNDQFFVRVLSYAPDPLLATLTLPLSLTQEEPPLPIDPEPIRVISPEQTRDDSGLDAMQPLIGATQVNTERPRHFIVPLPPGLFPDSRELFGFFVYELRAGHSSIWSTAQGRFGHPLRITGVQHPPPQLVCNVVRDHDRIFMSARYAESVYQGESLTPSPPRTDIWGLLYSQVLQTDGNSYRNILVGEKKFDKPVLGRNEKESSTFAAEKVKLKTGLTLLDPLPTGTLHLQSPDMPPYGQTWWNLKEVRAILRSWGLPADSPLSVLAVEIMPPYDNPDFAHYSDEPLLNLSLLGSLSTTRQVTAKPTTANLDGLAFYQPSLPPPPQHFQTPLSADLGKVRILRTSPLTPVPDVCAPE